MEKKEYKMNLDTMDEIENAWAMSTKARLLINRLISDELEPISRETLEAYKHEIIVYANILFDYVYEVSELLNNLVDNGEVFKDEQITNI